MQITHENIDQFFRSIDEKYHTESIQYEDEYGGMFFTTIRQLPVKVQYFIIDQAYKMLNHHNIYLDNMLEILYKNLIEYVYIPLYRDGSHTDAIHTRVIEIQLYLEIAESLEIGDTIYEYFRSCNDDKAYERAREDVIQTIHEDERIGNKDHIISIDLIPEKIPVELWLKNILNAGYEGILNKYKPINCDEDRWLS